MVCSLVDANSPMFFPSQLFHRSSDHFFSWGWKDLFRGFAMESPLWLDSLALADPTYILPVLTSAIMPGCLVSVRKSSAGIKDTIQQLPSERWTLMNTIWMTLNHFIQKLNLDVSIDQSEPSTCRVRPGDRRELQGCLCGSQSRSPGWRIKSFLDPLTQRPLPQSRQSHRQEAQAPCRSTASTSPVALHFSSYLSRPAFLQVPIKTEATASPGLDISWSPKCRPRT